MVSVIQLKRKQDETQLEYHKRLVYGKLVDKTLSDVDYTELSDYVYGQSYSSDVARRMLYGSRRTLELMDKELLSNINDSKIIDEIDAKIIELNKEKRKFFDQRREFNKLISSEARFEHLLCDVLSESVSNLNNTVGILYPKPHTSLEYTNNDGILVLSDWHYGMETQNAFNKFNTAICRTRVSNLIESTIEKLLLHQCKRLHIVILGDLYHGAIHNSARVASEELVCDQIMQVSEILAQSIEYLGQFVEEVLVYSTYGNHGRTVQNKHDSVHRDNMERLIPWWLKQRLSQHSNIKVIHENSDEFMFINSYGHEFCATHGDNDTIRNSPRLLTTLFQKKYGKNIEYILIGDKHHRESFEELNVTAMICGSLCGTDDYANNKRLYSTPSQLLLITNEKNGVDAEYRIKC